MPSSTSLECFQVAIIDAAHHDGVISMKVPVAPGGWRVDAGLLALPAFSERAEMM